MLLNKKRALNMMNRYEVDALIASSPENITYLSNFPAGFSFLTDVETYVILPYDQDIKPVIVISKNAVDLFLASNSWINDIELWGEFYFYESDEVNYDAMTPLEKEYAQVVYQKSKPTALEALSKALQERGLIDACLGVDEKGFSPIQYENMNSILSQANIIYGSHIFDEIRIVKTEEEIHRLRIASQINEIGMQALVDALKLGITEREVAEIYNLSVIQNGGLPVHACVQGGTRGALVSGEPTNYAFKMGDGIRLDFNCSYSSYYADLARTAVIGKPSKKLEKYSEAILAGVLEVEKIIKPGIKVSEVFEYVLQTVRSRGLPKIDRHHAGHGIGLCCCEAPIISRNNNTVLEKGNVFCIETPIYEIGFGCVHIEDTVVVNDTGCERIQTSNLDLTIIN